MTAAAGRTPDTRGRFARLLPALVLLALVVAAVVLFLLSHKAVNDQSDRILKERTSEVVLILNNALANIGPSVQPLGVAARLGDSPTRSFLEEARNLRTATGAQQNVALVRRERSGLVVAASVSAAPKQGTRLAGVRAATVRRALTTPRLVSTGVFRDAGRSLIGFVAGPPIAPAGSAIYLEAPVNPRATNVGQQQAFHELKAVVYASTRPDPRQVVVATTNDYPLRGDDVARSTITFGADRWLLQTSPREALIGGFATAVPWIVLGVGLLSALVATAVAVVLVRRRDYALALVDERTAELRSSLDALEDAQAKLVLQERLAAIGQVAAAVGHELRNPLGVLTNALYLIRVRVPEEAQPAVGRHLDTAEREVAAAAGIVESLLDFAREREPVTEAVDLAELVEESLTVAQPPREVEVDRAGLDGVPPVRADRQQLRQVLLNLLTNGYEAMGGAGTLRITAAQSDGFVEVRVTDTGPGMDDQTAARVFEPFFTTKAKGIGLGLPVTKRIVEKHGGTIAAETTAGAGTAFVLRIPSMVGDSQ
jgi:signal transduction histidine kinase